MDEEYDFICLQKKTKTEWNEIQINSLEFLSMSTKMHMNEQTVQWTRILLDFHWFDDQWYANY